MQANLDGASSFTFVQEGGYSSDSRDAGNWSSGEVGVGALIGSNFGVSAPQLIAWLKPQQVTAATMKSLTRSVAEAIYGARYWQALRCADLPGGVDLMVADMGYNAGDVPSGKLLQQQLGLVGSDVDGWVGDQTIAELGTASSAAARWASGLTSSSAKALQAALKVAPDGAVGPATLAALAATTAAPALSLCAALADRQAQHYRSLATFSVYGNGWLARVSRRLTAALAIAAAPAGTPAA